MSIMKFYNIFFSPTGGTKKVADIIINGTRQEAEVIDLIKDPEKIKKLQLKRMMCVWLLYLLMSGRIPSVITDMFRNVKADGTKAILTVVFGNRAIDDTLLELQDVLEASGFVCIAGMEAVAEHSLMHQFGTGRPDSLDEKELMGFAAKIMENITTQKTPEFPGNRPYRQYGGVPFKPIVNKKCTSCGLCAKECPTGAISLDDPKITDNDKCISCMHCVAVCPKNAKNYSKFISFIAGRKMKKICSDRKENKLYL
ncbi:MAG: 4Fe-4S binding protein [Coprococcus sp.]